MTGSTDTEVLVVGGGPAGALLAWLLASRGIDTILVERQRDFAREFRGEVLMPSGQAMLLASGLALDAVPHVVPSRVEMYLLGNRFLELEFDLEAAEAPIGVSQPALLEALVAEAGSSPTFRFERGTSVRDLLREEDRVVGARVEDEAGVREIRATLVVGADGRASVVRRKQNHVVRDLGAPMDVVWMKLPWPAAWAPRQVAVHLGGGHLAIALPAADDGSLQLAWVILKGTYGELRSRGVEAWADQMAEHVDPLLGAHVRDNLGKIERPFLLDAVTDRVEGWARPGSLLIGDAAHTMSPVGGQGLNVAMRDAVIAANHLVPAIREKGDLDAACARVEAERGPEIDTIQRLASIPPRFVLGTRIYHTWARRLLSRLAPIAARRGKVPGVVSTFLDGTGDVRLRV